MAEIESMQKIEFEKYDNGLGLNEDISEEDKELAYKLTKEILEEIDAYNEEKNLEKDMNRIPGQEFVLVSFVGPDLTAKTENYGMRIMGAFPDIESAADHADIIKKQKSDGKFDTGVIEMYNFVYSYPIREEETQEDVDRGLNEILIKHKTDLELCKQLFEIRKEKLMKNKGKNVESEKPEDVPDSIPLGPPSSIPSLEYNVEGEGEGEENEYGIKGAKNPTHARLLKKLKKRQDELATKSNIDEINEDLKKELENMNKKESLNTHITETRIEGQNYVAICFVGHKGENKRIAVKFMGVFQNREECEEHCKMLIEFDDTYDIVPTEMYGWIPCDPDLSGVKQVYNHDELNQMVDAHDEANDKSMKHHDERVKGSKTDREIQNETILRKFEEKNKNQNSSVEIKDITEEEEEVPELEAVGDNGIGKKTSASALYENMLNDNAQLARERERN